MAEHGQQWKKMADEEIRLAKMWYEEDTMAPSKIASMARRNGLDADGTRYRKSGQDSRRDVQSEGGLVHVSYSCRSEQRLLCEKVECHASLTHAHT